MDRDDSAGGAAGGVEALFGCHLRQLFVAVIDVEQGEVGVVIRIGVLGIALAYELVVADLQRVAEAHLHFVRLVECGAGETDEERHNTEVHQVTAVAAIVAASEQPSG